jgi:hypothetical protein
MSKSGAEKNWKDLNMKVSQADDYIEDDPLSRLIMYAREIFRKPRKKVTDSKEQGENDE